MIKKTVKYTDYNGTQRTEDFWFHLSKAELMEMEYGITGGLTAQLQKLIATLDSPGIIAFFKDFVLKAYGEKSADGRRFIKNNELRTEFEQTPAYSEIFMELSMDDKAAAEFINGVIPGDLAEQLADVDATKLPEQE